MRFFLLVNEVCVKIPPFFDFKVTSHPRDEIKKALFGAFSSYSNRMMVSAAPTDPPPSNTTVATKPKIWREIWLPATSVVMSDTL